MTTLKIKNVGQITDASLTFGDLTVLVGPQATGKSIALQLLKLMVDAGQVQGELSRYGLDWSGQLPDFLDVYLGEGMRAVWRQGRSSIEWEGKAVDLPQLAARKRRAKTRISFLHSGPACPCPARRLATPFHRLHPRRSVRCPGDTAKNSAFSSSKNSAPPATYSPESGA